MVGTLHALINHGVGGMKRILGLSENSRVRAVSALADQFQRLAVRAPIRPALTTNAEGSSLSTRMQVNKSSLPEDHAVALTTCPEFHRPDHIEAKSNSTVFFYRRSKTLRHDEVDWTAVQSTAARQIIHKGDVVLILDERPSERLFKVKVVQCEWGNMSKHPHPIGWFKAKYFSTTMVDPAP